MDMKGHILAALNEQFGQWQALLAGRGEARLCVPDADSGWSPKDDIAHLHAWQQRSLAYFDAARLGRAPEFPAWQAGLDPEAADVDALNAWLLAAYRDQPWEDVHRAWQDGFERLLAAAQDVSQRDLLDANGCPGLPGRSLADVLLGTYDHHQEHFEKLRPRLQAAESLPAADVLPAASGLPEVVAFILELDKLKAVTRKTKPLGLDRYENSAEHSWQIAVLAACLAPHAGPGVDINHVIRLLLVHDIGEIDAGDTLVYAEGGWVERKAAERAAVTRIFGLLPEPARAEFLSLWEEFEAAESPAARLAHAADRAMPALLNLANDGQSWRENGIRPEQVARRIGPPIAAGCPELWAYLQARLEGARQAGWFGMA